MKPIFNGEVWFAAPTKAGSQCEARVYKADDRRILAIFIQCEPMIGYSVTNGIERYATALASKVIQLFSVDLSKLTIIEHYPAHTRPEGETFDLVEMPRNGGKFGLPKWKPYSRAQLEALIGGKFEL